MLADSSDVAFLLIDGYSLLGVTTQLSDPGFEHETVERLYLGSEIRQKKLNGISSCDIEQSGDLDDAAGSVHAALVGGGTDRVLSWGATGNTIGKHFVGALVGQIAYNPQPQVGDFVSATARYNCTEHDDGLIIANLAARTAAGSTEASYVDGAAPSTLGGVGYLQLTALTLGGYDDLIIKVRHSADHTAWADLATFTARTAIGAQRLAVVTNPILRYLAVSWAWTGAGAGQTATFAVGFCRNQ